MGLVGFFRIFRNFVKLFENMLAKNGEISARSTFCRRCFSKISILEPFLPSDRRKPPISNAISFFIPYLNPLPNPYPSQKLDLDLKFPFQVPIPRNLPSRTKKSRKFLPDPKKHYFAIVNQVFWSQPKGPNTSRSEPAKQIRALENLSRTFCRRVP